MLNYMQCKIDNIKKNSLTTGCVRLLPLLPVYVRLYIFLWLRLVLIGFRHAFGSAKVDKEQERQGTGYVKYNAVL